MAIKISGTTVIDDSKNLLNVRINPRISTTASVTSPLVWNSDNFDEYVITAQAGALTFNADAGTPVHGQKMIFRIKDNGTARALTWTSVGAGSFNSYGSFLPTTTTVSKTTYFGFIYNSTDSKWDAVAMVTEA